MTLFAYLALPLFVVALTARSAPRGAGELRALLPWFAGAALAALALYPLAGLLARAFPPFYEEPRLLYLRALAVDHGAPLAAALAVALGLRGFRERRGAGRSGLLRRAAQARPERPAPARRHTRRQAELAYLLATLGGFFSVFSLLQQLELHADPSFYRLILLPLLRVALVSAAACLLARTAGARIWWQGLALLAALALPFLTAAIAYGAALRRTELAAAGSAVVCAAALLPLLRACRREVSNAPEE